MASAIDGAPIAVLPIGWYDSSKISTFTEWALACGIVAIGATVHQGPPPAQPPPPLAPTLKAGDVAPALALQGSDGNVHRLADYKGKTVIVAWFRKAFTGG
jgi:hypothetical protein